MENDLAQIESAIRSADVDIYMENDPGRLLALATALGIVALCKRLDGLTYSVTVPNSQTGEPVTINLLKVLAFEQE